MRSCPVEPDGPAVRRHGGWCPATDPARYAVPRRRPRQARRLCPTLMSDESGGDDTTGAMTTCRRHPVGRDVPMDAQIDRFGRSI